MDLLRRRQHPHRITAARDLSIPAADRAGRDANELPGGTCSGATPAAAPSARAGPQRWIGSAGRRPVGQRAAIALHSWWAFGLLGWTSRVGVAESHSRPGPGAAAHRRSARDAFAARSLPRNALGWIPLVPLRAQNVSYSPRTGAAPKVSLPLRRAACCAGSR